MPRRPLVTRPRLTAWRPNVPPPSVHASMPSDASANASKPSASPWKRLLPKGAAAEKAAADKAAAEQAEAERLAAEQKAKVDWFVSPLFGKERRTRDEDVASKTVLTSECAPLFGVKFGAEYKVSPTFKIAPSMGVALNFQTGGHSSLFGEVEANYVMSEKSYVGAGFGVWDINHGSWITPTMSVQFGHQLWTNAKLNKL